MEPVNRIADYIITVLHESGEEVSKLKLQKLLYFAQGLYLAHAGVPLFPEELEAWRHGPVSRTIHERFRGRDWSDVGGDGISPPEDLPIEVKTHLDLVIGALGGVAPFVLRTMTHKTDPWLEAWRASESEHAPAGTISKESMRAYFSKLDNEVMGAMCRDLEDTDADGGGEDLTLDQVRRMRESA